MDYTEAIQDPQTGIQMQERLVVNQTKKVFTGTIGSSLCHDSFVNLRLLPGADAIKWLVDRVEGIPSVEAAQVVLVYGEYPLN